MTQQKDAGGSLIGAVVGGHEIVSVLGEGGMGEVYVARHQTQGTARAVKVIHDNVAAAPSLARRFLREAKVLSELSHPNIVSVVAFGHLPGGSPYLVLELIEGGDLHALIEKRGAMALHDGLTLLLQLARVLAFAHRKGVVHRDLKPANVLLRDGDPAQIKVIDFGLVRLLTTEKITQLTEAAQIMGSPDYMAPEQANALPDVREPADVYAWAGIGYAALSAQSVFGPRPPLAAVYAQARETPPRLSERVAIPEPLDDLLYACLAKDPAARPHASHLVTELESMVRSASPARFAVTAPPGAAVQPALAATGPLPDSLAGEFAAGSGTAPAAVAPVPRAAAPGLADVIFADPARLARSRVREALSRQMLAVVLELADALALGDPDLASRRRIIDDVDAQLEEVGIEAAMLDAELAAASLEERVALEDSRAQVAGRTARLKTLLEAEQRQLAEVVGDRRHRVAGEANRLSRELDEMLERARAIDGGDE